jgi:membrane protein
VVRGQRPKDGCRARLLHVVFARTRPDYRRMDSESGFGRVAAQGEVIRQFQSLMGAQASSLIESIIRGSVQSSFSVPSAVVGFTAIILGASGTFNELQDAFNTIWKVESRGKSFWLISLGQRLFSLSPVAATGFILLTSLLVNAAIAFAQRGFVTFHPISAVFLHAVNFLLQP